MAELDGLGVLVTRPAHQAEALCTLLRVRGAVPLRLPLLAIGVPRAPARAREALRSVAQADWLIVTSPNAARRLRGFLPPRAALPPVACLGEGTQRALEEAGFRVDLRPASGTTSEAMLAEPAFSSGARALQVIVVRGEGGRRRLESVLRERGARVRVAAVYRRRPTYPQPEKVARLIGETDVAIVTSGDGLKRLVTLTPASAQRRLMRLQLVAPSVRVVQKALHFGFAHAPLVPERVSDSGFVDAICAWGPRAPARGELGE